MTSADRNQDDLVPAQEKLEWVTPKIALMGAYKTSGSHKMDPYPQESTQVSHYGQCGGLIYCKGPS